MDFPHLFSPLRINTMVTKNRIVATPTGDFFEDKALGGAGIVIAGHAIVEPGRSSFASADEPDPFTKYEVEETRRRVLKIHQAGARASIELFHGGQYARVHEFARGPVSLVRADGVEVRGMTPDDMTLVADLFATAALNARDLGFDMVFLHFGHGWLPAQFLSPRNNHRTDEYGGTLENRARFPLQILAAVRRAVGPGFPVDMRISAYEFMEDSIEFPDVLEFIRLAERYLDTVHISAGVDIGIQGNVHCSTTNFEPHMPNAAWAAEVKKNVAIPVSVVGAVMTPAEAEELIASGHVDMVALGRPLIADPDWPRKAQEGRADEIVPCIRCLQCYHISTNRRNVGCSVNPRFWNESFVPRDPVPAPRRKHVVVVGGGPGGLTAALTASRRGHRVTLLEKEHELGGQLRHVAREHYKQDVKAYLEYLLRQAEASDVTFRLGTEATPEAVAALSPDALVVAIGATEVIPPIPGIDRNHVLTGIEAIQRDADHLGERVVVVGAGSIGTEIGLELARLHAKHVTLVEMGGTYAPQGNSLYREGLRQKLTDTPNLAFRFGSRCARIDERAVLVVDEHGVEELVRADTVVVSVGMRARAEQAQAYYGIIPEVVMVGDCVRPRIIMDAVFEGHTYALNV